MRQEARRQGGWEGARDIGRQGRRCTQMSLRQTGWLRDDSQQKMCALTPAHPRAYVRQHTEAGKNGKTTTHTHTRKDAADVANQRSADRQTDRQKVNSASQSPKQCGSHAHIRAHPHSVPATAAGNQSVGRSVGQSVDKHAYLHCKHTHTSTSTHTHVVRQHAVFCCFWSFVVFGITGQLFKYQHLPSPLLSSQ